MKNSSNNKVVNNRKSDRSSAELEVVLRALNAYAKSLNYDTRYGESKSFRALQTFSSEVRTLPINNAAHDLLWNVIFSLSKFQTNVRRKLKTKTIEERDESMRNWGAFAILTVALFLIVVMFLFGLFTSSSWTVFLCFGCSSISLAVVALFYYGEYGKACDLLRSVVDKIDLIKRVDVKIEQLNETLNRP